MIKNTQQQWTPGQTVRVGFLQLVVKAAISTPGDYRPDAYLLTNAAGTKLYRFVPHHGLTAISVDEARAELAAADRHAQRLAAVAITKARASERLATLFA